MIKTYIQPKYQDFHLEGILHVSPKEAFEDIQKQQAVLVDVRETHEVNRREVDLPGVLYHPMSVIMDRLVYIPSDRPVYVICEEGIRSAKIANLLKLQGFEEAANVDGGLSAWIASGLPCKEKEHGNCSSCGCGCS